MLSHEDHKKAQANDTTFKEELADEEEGDKWIWDDATWILCSSFIIFTMQTGSCPFS